MSEKQIEQQLRVIKDVLYTLIAWMPQSAVSPININDARELLKRLDKAADPPASAGP